MENLENANRQPPTAIVPLYSFTSTVVKAYQCGVCEMVTRTRRGLKVHLLRKHGIVEQLQLFDDKK